MHPGIHSWLQLDVLTWPTLSQIALQHPIREGKKQPGKVRIKGDACPSWKAGGFPASMNLIQIVW